MSTILNTFSVNEWILVVLIYIWSGFVRSGLGFGGAALALPFMLLLRPDPLFWLPIIGLHLLLFTTITVIGRLSNIDWAYLLSSMKFMIGPKLIGVLGLVVLPQKILLSIVYSIILAYAMSQLFSVKLVGKGKLAERTFLMLGGYASGTSLVGAPLIVAAYSEHVAKNQLRDTLFALWFIMVCIKMTTLVMLDVPLQWQYGLLLLPAAGIGHVLGLRMHEFLVSGDDTQFRRALGFGLSCVAVVGIIDLILS